jgi:hypothetical protein
MRLQPQSNLFPISGAQYESRNYGGHDYRIVDAAFIVQLFVGHYTSNQFRGDHMKITKVIKPFAIAALVLVAIAAISITFSPVQAQNGNGDESKIQQDSRSLRFT